MAIIKNISKRTPISQFKAAGFETPAAGEIRLLGFDSAKKIIDYGTLDIDPRLIGNRIINPGILVINSPTSATLTGAVWVFGGVTYSFTGNVTMAAKPTDPNNRFDLITAATGATPVYQTGTAASDAVIPSPTTAGHLILQTIYRPHTDPDIVDPTPPASEFVYETLNTIGGNGLYAPIWRQAVEINRSYDFKIGYVFWTSDYSGTNNHRVQNGTLLVNFVTNAANRLIDPARVRVVHIDPQGRPANFALVQTSPTEVTLYARKTGFHGTHIYNYLGAKNPTVLNSSLLNGQAYAALPGDATTYLSSNAFLVTAGAGLSLNADGNPQLGDGQSLVFVPRTGTNNDAEFTFRGEIHGVSETPNYDINYHLIPGEFYVLGTGPNSNFLYYSTLFTDESETFITAEAFPDSGIRYSSVHQVVRGDDSFVELEATARIGASPAPVRGKKIILGYVNGVWKSEIEDTTATPKGLENAGDYEANFTARSLVTKQYADGIVAAQYVAVPITPTSTGVKGQRAYDSTYVYECIETNTWARYARELTVWGNS
jgi:hypothetical protein